MNTLVETRRQEIGSLCVTYRVRRLAVFGSALDDTFDPASSDIDFAVEFEPLPPRHSV